jgi:cell division control protein 7
MIRPRHVNAKVPFDIHHDELTGEESVDEEEMMEESREEQADESQEIDAGDYSDTTDESDNVVEPSVQEDMNKFQETFKGINKRFRLINRIGEGK